MYIYLQMIESPEDKLKFEHIYETYEKHMYYVAHKVLNNAHDSEAVITVELNQNQLQTVKFDFTTNENYAEWFEEQLANLIALYGEDYDLAENTNDQFASSIYKWETENSSLQFILLTGKTIKPAITLGVTKK